jgi:opacity protein-like surface antigen
MSRSTSAVAVLALAWVAATTSAAAQQLPRARFGLGAGATTPRGEFHADALGEGFKTGWQGMFFLEFRAPEKPLGVRVDAVFGSNAANDQWNASSTAIAGQPVTDKMRILGGNVDVIYSVLRSAHGIGAYVLGGVGTYRLTLSSTSTSAGITVDTSETKFAWNVGGGLTYPLRRAAMFLELRYCDAKSTFFASGKAPFVALTAGLRLRGS